MTEIIKIFLSELNPMEPMNHPSGSFAFWSMLAPISKEVSSLAQSVVESKVLEVFEVECAGVKISSVVWVKVGDKSDNPIFAGHITREGKITLYPIRNSFQD